MSDERNPYAEAADKYIERMPEIAQIYAMLALAWEVRQLRGMLAARIDERHNWVP